MSLFLNSHQKHIKQLYIRMWTSLYILLARTNQLDQNKVIEQYEKIIKNEAKLALYNYYHQIREMDDKDIVPFSLILFFNKNLKQTKLSIFDAMEISKFVFDNNYIVDPNTMIFLKSFEIRLPNP